jgi:hypothetical protein
MNMRVQVSSRTKCSFFNVELAIRTNKVPGLSARVFSAYASEKMREHGNRILAVRKRGFVC